MEGKGDEGGKESWESVGACDEDLYLHAGMVLARLTTSGTPHSAGSKAAIECCYVEGRLTA